MNRLSQWLLRLSSAWTLGAATACYLFFLATVMPEQSAASRVYAGEWGAPDRHLVYTPQELYEQVATWGAAGRRDYIEFRLGLDILWAISYTSFLVFAIGCAARSAFEPDDRRRLLNLVPLVTMVFDYAENALGIFLVSGFPARHDAIAWLASMTTAGKWLTLVIAHAVLVYAVLIAAGARRRRNRRPARD